MKNNKKFFTHVCCHGVTNECLQLSHPVKHNHGPPKSFHGPWRPVYHLLGTTDLDEQHNDPDSWLLWASYLSVTYAVNKLQKLNLNPYIPKMLNKIKI